MAWRIWWGKRWVRGLDLLLGRTWVILWDRMSVIPWDMQLDIQ